MIQSMSLTLQARADRALASMEQGLFRLMTLWLLLAASACSIRVATSPVGSEATQWGTTFPYLAVSIAPLLAMALALKSFAPGEYLPQPEIRLARLGRWRNVSLEEARTHPLYGANGFMVSLLIGMLLNVPVRLAEFLVATPAIHSHVPMWLSTLHLWMTIDVVLLTSMYAVCFVAALRRVPIFPRLLALTWLIDLSMQLVVANSTAMHGVPANVAGPLSDLLNGNVQKVLISISLWGPYLLLSRRVNVTYRRRVEA